MEYLNTVLYGLFCTPRDQRRDCAALFYQSPEYARLMAFLRRTACSSAAMFPCGSTGPASRWLWTKTASPRRWFYWKFHWLCMHTAYLRWKPLLK